MQNEQIQDYNESLKQELDQPPSETKEMSPNNPPWNSLIGILTWVGSIILIAVIPTVFILVYLLVQRVPLTDGKILQETIQSDPYALMFNLLGIIPAHLLTILFAWIIVTWGKKYSFKEMLGWKMGGFNILYLIGITIGFFVLAALVSQVLPEQENDFLKMLQSSKSAVYIVAIMATLTAPLVEEVVYRGIMYSAFQRTFGIPVAVFLVTLLFAAVHVPQYYPSYSTILMICLLSLVLTMIRVKSENLLPCIILHTIFNGVQSIALVVGTFYDQKPVIENAQPALSYFLN